MMNGTMKCLKRERDDDGTDDEEAFIDENNLAIQSDEKVHTFDYIHSRSGITYTSQLSECSRKIYCELFSGTQIEWFGSFPVLFPNRKTTMTFSELISSWANYIS